MRRVFWWMAALFLPCLLCSAALPGSLTGAATIRVDDGAAGSSSPAFSIATTPALVPAFAPSFHDYVVPCTSAPTTNLTTTGTGPVKVGGSRFDGPVDLDLPLVAGQEVTVTEHGASFSIRCLPADFPAYTSSVTGTPQAGGYLLGLGSYTIAFDGQGVPVWWYHDPDLLSPFDPKFLTSSTIAFSDSDNHWDVVNLRGKLLHTAGGGSVPLDLHDFQRLPNGNYLGIMPIQDNCPAVPAQCTDLSSWGLSAQSSITDEAIVELNAKNEIVWSWDVVDHIDVATSNVNWRDLFPDVIHMNSIEYDGNGGIIFSVRHFDAVYRIDMATGDITWKLGGTPTPQSLTVSGDQYLDAGGQLFSGQHDARLQPDGSLTVYDDGTRADRAPRALHFTIDTSTMTADEVGQMTDPQATYSPYMGGAELLPGGDWVVAWGGIDFMSEQNAQGVPQLTITYPGSLGYQVNTVAASLNALRSGMNAVTGPLLVSQT